MRAPELTRRWHARSLTPPGSGRSDQSAAGFRPRVIRASLAGLVAVALAVVLPAFDSAPASAALIHQFTGEFSVGGGGAEDLAVDSAGNVYVLFESAGVIEKFDASGNPVNFSALGTNVLSHGFSFEPNSGAAVAVDNSAGPAHGYIYVTNTRNDAVNVFDEAGNYVGDLPAPGGGELLGLDVNSAGTILVGNWTQSEALAFKPKNANPAEDTEVGTLGGLPFRPGYVAIDSTGAAYVSQWSNGPLIKYEADSFEGGAVASPFAPNPFAETSLAFEVDPETNDIFVDSGSEITQYTGGTNGHPAHQVGPPFGAGHLDGGSRGIAVDAGAAKTIYATDGASISKFGPVVVPDVTTNPPVPNDVGHTSAMLSGEVGLGGGGDVVDCKLEWGTDTNYTEAPVACTPPASNGSPYTETTKVSAELTGLPSQTTYHYRFSASNANGTDYGEDQTVTPSAVLAVSTEAATELEPETATLHGSFTGEGLPTHYYFEYGADTSYGFKTEEVTESEPSGHIAAQAALSSLGPGNTYHYRFVARNSFGTTPGEDMSFVAPQAPTIIGLSSSNLQETSAVLTARINPEGVAVKYHFEFGTTVALGSSTPVEELPATSTPQVVSAPIEGLETGTYHFRVVAESIYGTTVSEDQTFNFSPPNCPNDHVRQQTGAGYLPDCRAYELVSPESQGDMTPFPATAPASETAIDPSRLAYVGAFGDVPGIGEPSNSIADMYVATRTSQGWVSKYIGLPDNQSFLMGGPPADASNELFGPAVWQMGVVADPSLNRIVDWSDGWPHGTYNGVCPCLGGSNAAYVWDSTSGSLLGRFPTNLASVTEGEEFAGQPYTSRDLSHYVFTSNLIFAEGGVAGDTYDNDTTTGTTSVVSRAPNGADKQGTTVKVSSDGSHILMSAAGHLYVRINDLATAELAPGHATNYVGMNGDGTIIYFISDEQLTPEDKDTSADLYMWSEKGEGEGKPLTLVSKVNGHEQAGEVGNSDSCSATWTSQCGVVSISFGAYAQLFGGLGGNCGYAPTCQSSDSFIASGSGDIYFYSPEQLDGTKGIANRQNLYVYRNERVQYVTTMKPVSFCTSQNHGTFCSAGPVVRMDVTPDDTHMAFLTSDRIGTYENGGHTELYSYNPVTSKLHCDSCIPSGEPPSGDVFASQNGLFMTDDGRTFFSTSDALVAQDTNQNEDVYEYAEGRPQLITPGTGAGNGEIFGFIGAQTYPGLVSVSADGTDVYFSTFDVLVGQDRNGDNLKLYDARSDGGFSFVPPPPGCAAADECHGPGSSPPSVPVDGTGTDLGAGGNFGPSSKPAAHGHPKRRRHHSHHRAHGKRRGGHLTREAPGSRR